MRPPGTLPAIASSVGRNDGYEYLHRMFWLFSKGGFEKIDGCILVVQIDMYMGHRNGIIVPVNRMCSISIAGGVSHC
jgi:hypothetical protein